MKKFYPLTQEPVEEIFTANNFLTVKTERSIGEVCGDLSDLHSVLQKLEMLRYLLSNKGIKLNRMNVTTAQRVLGVVSLQARRCKRKAKITIAVRTIEDLDKIYQWGRGIFFDDRWTNVDDGSITSFTGNELVVENMAIDCPAEIEAWAEGIPKKKIRKPSHLKGKTKQ